MIKKKKSILETLDRALVDDVFEMQNALEKIDASMIRAIEQDAEAIKKKWGHPVIYDDPRHILDRTRKRRERQLK